MPVVKKPFKRTSGFRDAKLIVIATEGAQTEQLYFESLKAHYHRSNVHVEILKRVAIHQSAPVHVMRELDAFKSQYKLVEGDELWMVIDKDRWTQQHLSDVARCCEQKKYFIALSVPCFELWLLLHLEDFRQEGSDQISCEQIENKIRTILGSYDKTNPDIDTLIPNVFQAIERAQRLDTNPDDRWPQQPGSRVYLLVNNIVY